MWSCHFLQLCQPAQCAAATIEEVQSVVFRQCFSGQSPLMSRKVRILQGKPSSHGMTTVLQVVSIFPGDF